VLSYPGFIFIGIHIQADGHNVIPHLFMQLLELLLLFCAGWTPHGKSFQQNRLAREI
jgi:hypothetical protein